MSYTSKAALAKASRAPRPAAVPRKLVVKRYGALSTYTLAPGESAYERRRREQRERAS